MSAVPVRVPVEEDHFSEIVPHDVLNVLASTNLLRPKARGVGLDQLVLKRHGQMQVVLALQWGEEASSRGSDRTNSAWGSPVVRADENGVGAAAQSSLKRRQEVVDRRLRRSTGQRAAALQPLGSAGRSI